MTDVCPACAANVVRRDGWAVLELDTCIVVVPMYEEGHALGRECWCSPRIMTEEDHIPFRIPMATHRDLLERSVDPG